MSFGGSTEPCAFVEFSSIGGFSNTEAIAKELTDAICDQIKVSKDRFVTFPTQKQNMLSIRVSDSTSNSQISTLKNSPSVEIHLVKALSNF